MYSFRFWIGHVCIVVVDFLHQKLARKVRDPFKALIPGKDIQVTRMNNANPKFLEKSPRYHSSRPFAPGYRQNRWEPIYSNNSQRGRPGIEYDQCKPPVPGEVTQVLWQSTFCTRNPLKRVEPMNSISFWRRHSGIEDNQCTP